MKLIILISLLLLTFNKSYSQVSNTNQYDKLPIPLTEPVAAIESWGSIWGYQDNYTYHSGNGKIFRGLPDIRCIPKCAMNFLSISNELEYEYTCTWLHDQVWQSKCLYTNYIENKDACIQAWYQSKAILDIEDAQQWLITNKEKISTNLYTQLMQFHPVYFSYVESTFLMYDPHTGKIYHPKTLVVHVNNGDRDRTYTYEYYMNKHSWYITMCALGFDEQEKYDDLVKYQMDIIADYNHIQQNYNKYHNILYAKILKYSKDNKNDLEQNLKNIGINNSGYYSPQPGVIIQGDMSISTYNGDGARIQYQHTKIDPSTGDWYPLNRSIGGMY